MCFHKNESPMNLFNQINRCMQVLKRISVCVIENFVCFIKVSVKRNFNLKYYIHFFMFYVRKKIILFGKNDAIKSNHKSVIECLLSLREFTPGLQFENNSLSVISVSGNKSNSLGNYISLVHHSLSIIHFEKCSLQTAPNKRAQ